MVSNMSTSGRGIRIVAGKACSFFQQEMIELIGIDEPRQTGSDRDGDKEASAVVKSSHCFWSARADRPNSAITQRPSQFLS